MLGEIIDRLDDPQVTASLLQALDDPDLAARLPGNDTQDRAETVATMVRGFVDTASDDHWVQLIGIMSRAPDPALAALRAILLKVLSPPAAGCHG
jgi:hypothetical protein